MSDILLKLHGLESQEDRLLFIKNLNFFDKLYTVSEYEKLFNVNDLDFKIEIIKTHLLQSVLIEKQLPLRFYVDREFTTRLLVKYLEKPKVENNSLEISYKCNNYARNITYGTFHFIFNENGKHMRNNYMTTIMCAKILF